MAGSCTRLSGFLGTPARDRGLPRLPKGREEERVTLTYPVLDSSAVVAFLVSGEGKRDIFDKILSGETGFPAAHIRPVGEVVWFADRAAAGRWAVGSV